MFRELEDIGLNVISDLSNEAIRLEREKKENINTRSSSNPKVVGGNITLHYQISSSGFVDPNGQPVIVTLSKNTLKKIIEDEYRYPGWGGIRINVDRIDTSLPYTMILYLDFYNTIYKRDAEEDIKMRLLNIGNTVRRYYSLDIMFQYSYTFYESMYGGGNGSSWGGSGIAGTKDPDVGIDTGGYDEHSMTYIPCYNLSTGKSNPLCAMGIMPPNLSNKKGARFGLTRKDEYGKQRMHRGIDLIAPPGTPVYSMYEGRIVEPYVTTQPNRTSRGNYPEGYKGDTNGAGNRITILSYVKGEYIKVCYWHLNADQPVAVRNGQPLKVGDHVSLGELIGFTGVTGNADEKRPHLHLGIKNSTDKWINPENYLNGRVDEESCVIITPCDKN